MDRHKYIRVAFHGFKKLKSDQRKRIYLDGEKVRIVGARARERFFCTRKSCGQFKVRIVGARARELFFCTRKSCGQFYFTHLTCLPFARAHEPATTARV